MSEVKTGYMAELDDWTNEAIIEPLADAYLRGRGSHCQSARVCA
jgi:hypothetical protein